MKIAKPLPPHTLEIRLAAETMAELKLYQRYQKDEGKESWDLKEMGGALLAVFLAEGDTEFLAWRKRQAQKPSGVTPAPMSPAVNGATDV